MKFQLFLLLTALKKNLALQRYGLESQNDRTLQSQDMTQYDTAFEDCVTTSSLNSLSNNDDLVCHYKMDPPTSGHQTTLHAYEDCSLPPPPTVALTESININGDITATVDLVRKEIGKVVNESNGGTIRFCVRTDVMELVDGVIDSVNFVKARVSIDIDLDGNFEVQPILLTEDDIGEMSFLKEYSVYSYQCDQATGIPTPPNHVITQGEIMAVCIEANGESTDTYIKEVRTWRLMQRDPFGGLPLVIVPVHDGSPTILSNYDCSLNDRSKCIIRTVVISMFFDNLYEFEDEEDGIIQTTGVVDLRIRGERRLSAERSLKSNEESMEEYGNAMMYFKVSFTVDKVDSSSGFALASYFMLSRLLLGFAVGNELVSCIFTT